MAFHEHDRQQAWLQKVSGRRLPGRPASGTAGSNAAECGGALAGLRPSRNMRSFPIVIPAHWSRRMAGSIGYASPGSTRPVCSDPCSIVAPAHFRLGPFGINIPNDRIYEPGTNTLVTSWRTPTGWATTREALAIGPQRGEDTVTPHTRPPADDDAEHNLVRTLACVEGRVEIELVCDPAFDYGRVQGEWSLSEDRHRAEVTTADQSLTLQTDMRLGIEANHVRARHVLEEGEELFCALCWADDAAIPSSVEEARAHLNDTTLYWRHWSAGAQIPDHELGPLVARSALAIKGLTYMPTGATVAALTTSLPETPRRRAQLGLPLHLDPGLHVHASGTAFPESRLGGKRVHAIHRRPRARR